MKILLFGFAAVVGFDALVSVLSMSLGFQYTSASAGSYLIYAVVGFFAARAKSRWFSLGIGAALGLTDATVGWAVSWALGPGRLPSGTLTPALWAGVAIAVIVVAAACAGVGGLIGHFTNRSHGTAA